MGAHAYIEAEDLGLTVLGTVQNSYTVDGVHRQDFAAAVYKASLCRITALESALASYAALVRARQTKTTELGEALAAIARGLAAKPDAGTTDSIKIGADAAKILRRYNIDANSSMKKEDVLRLQQNVQFAMDQEDNDLQQDMTMLQSFVSKRDDAMKMSDKLVKRVNNTRKQGIRYIGS